MPYTLRIILAAMVGMGYALYNFQHFPPFSFLTPVIPPAVLVLSLIQKDHCVQLAGWFIKSWCRFVRDRSAHGFVIIFAIYALVDGFHFFIGRSNGKFLAFFLLYSVVALIIISLIEIHRHIIQIGLRRFLLEIYREIHADILWVAMMDSIVVVTIAAFGRITDISLVVCLGAISIALHYYVVKRHFKT